MHSYECQTHLQTRFWCQVTKHSGSSTTWAPVRPSTSAMKKHHNLATLIPQYDEQNLFWKSPYLGIQKASQEVSDYGIENNVFAFDQFDPKSYLKAFRKLIKTEPDAVVMVPFFYKETSKIIEVLDEIKYLICF